MDKRGSFNRFIAVYMLGLIALIYCYPRLLVRLGGPDQPWTNYLYHYGFGLVFFCTGLVILLKSKACVPGRGYDRQWLRVLVLGFIGYASVHAIWIILALTIPFLGAQ